MRRKRIFVSVGGSIAVLLLTLGAATTRNPRGLDILELEHRERSFVVVALDPGTVELKLVGQAAGAPRTFAALSEQLSAAGRMLSFATNAGIFTHDQKALGLHIEAGRLLHAINVDEGDGNFFLKPNGVFWIDDDGAHVASTERALERLDPGRTRLATQSGPILVEKGLLHPGFDPDSKNAVVRSGVGVDASGRVLFAISRRGVRFYDMATLFRDHLGCPDALYLDGVISGLSTADVELGDPGRRYAGILYVSEPIPESQRAR